MTLAAALQGYLLTVSPVTALVSTRVYTQQFPQSVTYPAVRLTDISLDEPMHLRGPEGVEHGRVQVDAIATSKAGAVAVEEAVHGDGLGTSATGLKGFIGAIGGSPAWTIHAVMAVGRMELYDPEEIRAFRVSRDYLVSFTRA